MKDIKPDTIVVFGEKYGSRYYRANSNEEFLKVLNKVFRNRLEDSYWYSDLEKPLEPRLPSLTKEEVERLPMGQVKTVAKQEWTDYEYQIANNKNIERATNILNKAKMGDLGCVYTFMKARQHHEYEEWEIIELEVVE